MNAERHNYPCASHEQQRFADIPDTSRPLPVHVRASAGGAQDEKCSVGSLFSTFLLRHTGGRSAQEFSFLVCVQCVTFLLWCLAHFSSREAFGGPFPSSTVKSKLDVLDVISSLTTSYCATEIFAVSHFPMYQCTFLVVGIS